MNKRFLSILTNIKFSVTGELFREEKLLKKRVSNDVFSLALNSRKQFLSGIRWLVFFFKFFIFLFLIFFCFLADLVFLP